MTAPELHPLVAHSLAEHGIAHTVMECDPDFADTAAFCERYGVPPEQSANTIVVTSKRGPQRQCACVVLATTRLDVNRRVTALLEVSKASFAGAEQTVALTGMQIGGVTPFGLPEGLPLYIDSRVLEQREVVVGAGTRSAKLRVAPQDLLRLPSAEAVEGLASPAV